ncbi:hypothetical protein B0H11DRAFT_1904082 [Mycena galericulata]|nr:hypothetical protein B0H11DRAFT_1904082 [Mycena galericulata]
MTAHLPGRQRKRAEQREKGRVRMARHRLKLKSASVEEQEANRQRAREARARYRENDFASKFGYLAYEAKIERRLERAHARNEKKRRKSRLQALGKPKPSNFRRAVSSEDDRDRSDTELPRPAARQLPLLGKPRRRRVPDESSDTEPPRKRRHTGQNRPRPAGDGAPRNARRHAPTPTHDSSEDEAPPRKMGGKRAKLSRLAGNCRDSSDERGSSADYSESDLEGPIFYHLQPLARADEAVTVATLIASVSSQSRTDDAGDLWFGLAAEYYQCKDLYPTRGCVEVCGDLPGMRGGLPGHEPLPPCGLRRHAGYDRARRQPARYVGERRTRPHSGGVGLEVGGASAHSRIRGKYHEPRRELTMCPFSSTRQGLSAVPTAGGGETTLMRRQPKHHDAAVFVHEHRVVGRAEGTGRRAGRRSAAPADTLREMGILEKETSRGERWD